MKIITCAPLPPPHGGIANWYRILQEEAPRQDTEFLNIDTSPRKSIDGRSLFYRVVVQGLRMLKQYGELCRLIRKNPDARAAHITTSGQLALVRDILFLNLLRRKGIRSVYHIHFGRIPEIFEKKGMEYKLLRKALTLASATIAIDPKTYNILSNETEVYYVPNPVREIKIKAAEEKKNILFLGNVMYSKGVEELLTAWESVSEKYPEWTLTIAGFCENSYKEQLESRYSMKNVHLAGFMPHDAAMELLAEAAFLVLPSHTEGFPNVVIEAMMCEKAVLATDVGAIADILSGDCGIVFQAKDIEALTGGLERLISDPAVREKMGRRGKEKAGTQYAADVVFRRYMEIWKAV